MNEFIAFKAAVSLLKETGQEEIIHEVYRKSLAQMNMPKKQIVNYVKEIYAPFSNEEISLKIAQLLTPEATRARVEIVFQTIDGLHQACPNHSGDWYFSGDYPTPGGNYVVNNAFIHYINGHNIRIAV
jgi:amidophosphoribosyltransferase